jgi:hypothetical protein
MKIEDEVRHKVEGLLATAMQKTATTENIEYVIVTLTQMAMLGTAPPSCRQTRAPPD